VSQVPPLNAHREVDGGLKIGVVDLGGNSRATRRGEVV